MSPPIDLLDENNRKELKISLIREAIDSYAKNDNCFPAVIDAMQKAKTDNITTVDGDCLVQGIAACAMGTKNKRALEIAFWAFDVIKANNAEFLKSDSKHAMGIYESLLALCARYSDMQRAAALMKDFHARGHTYTSYLLSTYIMLAASDGSSKEVHEILTPLYTTYKVIRSGARCSISCTMPLITRFFPPPTVYFRTYRSRGTLRLHRRYSFLWRPGCAGWGAGSRRWQC